MEFNNQKTLGQNFVTGMKPMALYLLVKFLWENCPIVEKHR